MDWDHFLTTPLHEAASGDKLEIFKLVIEDVNDKNPKDKKEGRTPLHIAAEMGHLNICELIFENVDNRNPSDKMGISPFQLVIENSKLDVFHFFFDKLESSVNKNLKEDQLIDPSLFISKSLK